MHNIKKETKAKLTNVHGSLLVGCSQFLTRNSRHGLELITFLVRGRVKWWSR